MVGFEFSSFDLLISRTVRQTVLKKCDIFICCRIV